VQRHALALLFSLLTIAVAAVAAAALVGAHSATRVVVGLAALAVAGWFASLAFSLIRVRRR
jgi:hypothetical protein